MKRGQPVGHPSKKDMPCHSRLGSAAENSSSSIYRSFLIMLLLFNTVLNVPVSPVEKIGDKEKEKES